MRLAIVGSRTFSNGNWKSEAASYITKVIKWYGPEEIISGGAEGIDTLAAEIADEYNIPFISYDPEGRSWLFFKKRNKKIATRCTHLLSIRCVNATTYGSGWTADEAERQGKEVHRIYL